MEQRSAEGGACQYEISAFKFCKKKATVRLERNSWDYGCFCTQHAKKVVRELHDQGLSVETEKLDKEKL